MEMGKKTLSYHRNSCREDNILHQKHEYFYSGTTTDKTELSR